jgi:hypothetical protein
MMFNGQPLTVNDYIKIHEVVNMEANPVKYLGVDPGNANGICGYDERYYLVFMWTIQEADINKFLTQFEKIDTCVIENFSLYPNKAQQQIYSDMTTSRVIGRFEGWAARNSVKLVKQPASIKKVGYAWIGKKQPSKSDSQNHVKDAHVHFMYWAIRTNKLDAGVLLEVNRGHTDDERNSS